MAQSPTMTTPSGKRIVDHNPATLAKRLGVKACYLAGSTWKKEKIKKNGKASRTPGKSKTSDTCQLTPIAGYPRKFFCKARSYKNVKAYAIYCKFIDSLKGNEKRTSI